MREYREGRLSRRVVLRTLAALEAFHFLGSAVVGRRSSGEISQMYASHARQLLASPTSTEKVKGLDALRVKLKKRLPSLPEVEAAFLELRYSDLFTKQKRLVQYTLSRIDGAHQCGVKVNYDLMTIEHIAPQRPKSTLQNRVGGRLQP
jgi:hypothetical protein